MAKNTWMGFTAGLLVALVPVVIVTHAKSLAGVLLVVTALCLSGYYLAQSHRSDS